MYGVRGEEKQHAALFRVGETGSLEIACPFVRIPTSLNVLGTLLPHREVDAMSQVVVSYGDETIGWGPAVGRPHLLALPLHYSQASAKSFPKKPQNEQSWAGIT